MAVKERNSTMTDVRCMCGNNATYQIGSVPHFIFDREIVIQNIPHHFCEVCNSYLYDGDVDVSELLMQAFVDELPQIDWQKHKK